MDVRFSGTYVRNNGRRAYFLREKRAARGASDSVERLKGPTDLYL